MQSLGTGARADESPESDLSQNKLTGPAPAVLAQRDGRAHAEWHRRSDSYGRCLPYDLVLVLCLSRRRPDSEQSVSKALPMSNEAILTSKGRTTIPKKIREGLRVKRGDRMTFTLLPDGIVLIRVKNKSAMSVAVRFFKKGRKRMRVEDLSH